MNPGTIQLALALAEMAAKLVLDIRQQSGMTDDQLLDAAGKNDAEARAAAKAFLEKL